MMHLVLSDRMEALAAALVEQLTQERAAGGGDSFHAPTVIVSTPSIRAWLGFEIARRTGVAANIRFCFWREFLREPTIGADVDVTVPDTATVQARLVHELEAMESGEVGENGASPLLAPVRAYLAAGADPLGRDRRRFQLAGRLARLFDEYALNRPDMIAAWGEGRDTLADSDAAETEAWQRALWSRVFGERRRSPVAVLAEFTRAESVLPGRIHLFGFGYLAESYTRVLDALATRSEVFAYVLHPAGDTHTRDRDSLAGRWGRPGREFVARLGQADPRVGARFSPPVETPPDLLETLRCAASGTVASDRSAAREADASVRVFACPDIRRELETIAAEIWAQVESRPDLRFNEIAVILNRPDLEAYQAHLAAVFRAAHDIPFTCIDIEGGQGSRVMEAVERLIQLPFTRLTRPDVLGLVTHPSVGARFPDADPEDWVRWCEATAIFHGADRADLADTYVEKDLFNWDQGLRRLALGVFMTGCASGDERVYEAGGRVLVPEEISSSAAPSAAAFIGLVRSLAADARARRELSLPLESWARRFQDLLAGYLAPPADDGGEDEAQIELCRTALGALAEIDPGGRPVSARIAADFALARLGTLTGSRGRHLADGVVVSSFRPMRAIPFKVIFAVGMGEGKFPAAPARDPLDLRTGRRVAGDVDTRDQDRHLFLETLLSAREALFLSYVCRDATTGESLACSGVVQEVLDTLAPHLDDRGLVCRPPLLRGEDAAARAVLPAAANEWRAYRLGRSFAKAVGDPAAPAPDPIDLPEPLQAALARPLALCRVTPQAAPLPERLEIPLRSLEQLLLCPVQGWAAYVLGVSEDDDLGVHSAEDEPFAADRLFDTVVGREALRVALAERRPLAETHAAELDRRERTGHAPTGFFRRLESARQLECYQAWQENLAVWFGSSPMFRTVRFGRAREHEQVDIPAAAIELRVELRRAHEEAAAIEVELVGRTGLVTGDFTASFRPVMREGRKQADFVRGYIDHLALAAAGLGPADGRAIVVGVAGKPDLKKDRRVMADGLGADVARAQLGVLVAELLQGPHDYALPVEWVADLEVKDKAWAELQDNDPDEACQNREPLPRVTGLGVPTEIEARRMIETRFRFFPWAKV